MNWKETGIFDKKELKDILEKYSKDVKSGKNVLPAFPLIFNAFHQCKFDDLQVVILGQDPYPNADHAMGLAFSVNSYVHPIPRSLQNIYKEIKSDLGIDPPQNGDLTFLAEQGILLLNTALTVIEGQSASHSEIGWHKFTERVLKTISDKKEGIVFVLWGNHAQKFEYLLDINKHYIIKSAHPSPFSANKGFFGSKPFSKINQLVKREIKWSY